MPGSRRRSITVRHEKRGWKVCDISGESEFKNPGDAPIDTEARSSGTDEPRRYPADCEQMASTDRSATFDTHSSACMESPASSRDSVRMTRPIV